MDPRPQLKGKDSPLHLPVSGPQKGMGEWEEPVLESLLPWTSGHRARPAAWQPPSCPLHRTAVPLRAGLSLQLLMPALGDAQTKR